MIREDFFTKELAKLLLIKEDEVINFLARYKNYLRVEAEKTHNKKVTTNAVARGLVLILQDVRKKRGEQKQKKVLAKIRHKCLLKHWEKFLELHKLGLGAKRMERYFKDTLHCKITFPTLQKAINLLKEQENG